MTKETFLKELSRRLHQLPEKEVQQQLSYYEELLNDMMEDGIPEEDAVSKLGDVEEIAGEILQELPLPTLVKSRFHPKNGWTVAAITVAVLGSPLWLSLLLALVATVFGIVVAILAVIFSLFVCVLALAFASVAVVVRGVLLFPVNGGHAVFSIGVGLILLGVVCLAFLAAKYGSIGLYRGGRWLFHAAKGLLIVKEGKK